MKRFIKNNKTSIIISVLILIFSFSGIPHRILTLNGLQLDLFRDTSVWLPVTDSSLIITTVGSSGASTLHHDTLNIPIYSGGSGAAGWTGTDSAYVIDTYLPYSDSITYYATQYGLDTGTNHLYTIIDGLQTKLNGTGLVRMSGTSVSYDNTVYTYSLVAGSNITLNHSGGIYTVTASNSGGTVTSIATGTGILGGTITTSGTLYMDSTVIPRWDDTLSGNRWLVTVNYIQSLGYGTGTVTSIQVVSNAAAYSVTPTTATTTSGTYSIVPTGTSSQHVNGDGSLDNAVYIYSLVAGSNISLIKSGGIYTITSTNPGGTVTSVSTSTGLIGGTITSTGTLQIDSTIVPKWDDTLSGNRWLITLSYLKSLGYGTGTVTGIAVTAGNGNVRISGSPVTTTGTVNITPSEFPLDTATNLLSQVYSVVVTPSSGLNLYSTNQNGFDNLTGIMSSSLVVTYQPNIILNQVGRASVGATTLVYDGMWNGCFGAITGASGAGSKTYSATVRQSNYTYVSTTAAATANTSAGVASSASNTSKIYTGGSGFQAYFVMAFPVYTSAQRIFIGMYESSSMPATTTDPSSWFGTMGISKDAGDATFQFLTNSTSGSSTKVSTGITPNQSDIYIIEVSMKPFSNTVYITLMDWSIGTLTITNQYSTTAIGAAGTPEYPLMFANTGTAASSIQMNFISAGCIYY